MKRNGNSKFQNYLMFDLMVLIKGIELTEELIQKLNVLCFHKYISIL